jgi:alkylation response protein AidB-like acyl-CoA dehydrogenase
MDFSLSEEQNRLVALAERLGREVFAPKAARWDQGHEYPYENVEILKESGFLGMTIPKCFGGQERPLIDVALVVETIARYCGVTARIVVETNVGALGCVMAYGTKAQQTEIARRILEEGDKPAIGMTEPDAGTDLTALRARAVEKDDHYLLNGRKCWITGGGISRTHLVFARIIDRSGEDLGIGGILVDKGAPGFSLGRIEETLGLRGIPERELIFEDCVTPKENLILPEPRRSFRKLMNGYNAQRIGASCVALGLAAGAHALAVRYMDERVSGGRKLKEYQGLRWKMAQSEIAIEAARLLIHRAACNARRLDNNVMLPEMWETSLAKAFTARHAFEVVSDALQIFGASGYSRALPLERMLRDVRMFQIGGGTSEAQLNMIAKHIFPGR